MASNGYPKIQINFNVREAQGHILETSTLVNLRGENLNECVNLFNSLKKQLNVPNESEDNNNGAAVRLIKDNMPEKECPECGEPMVLRTAKNGKNPGRKFYGCSRYPMCETTLPC